jgi:hypothetical protein
VLVVAGILSFAVLSGIGQGWLLRRQTERPILWAISTGTGIAIAAAIVVENAESPSQASAIWRLGYWTYESFGLPVIPWFAMEYVFSGFIFGLVVGSAQAATLRLGWRWIGISVLAAVLASSWLYASLEIDPVTNALNQLAALTTLQGGPRALLIGAWVLLLAVFGFAFPTGAVLNYLLSRKLRIDDRALIRRFE